MKSSALAKFRAHRALKKLASMSEKLEREEKKGGKTHDRKQVAQVPARDTIYTTGKVRQLPKNRKKLRSIVKGGKSHSAKKNKGRVRVGPPLLTAVGPREGRGGWREKATELSKSYQSKPPNPMGAAKIKTTNALSPPKKRGNTGPPLKVCPKG